MEKCPGMEGSGRALGFQGVKDQLNQKFKLMVEDLKAQEMI